MNANELADELESTNNWMKDEGDWKDPTRVYSRVPFEAATMLRQQQDKLTKYELRHAEQRKRIDELEAELKLIDELVGGKK